MNLRGKVVLLIGATGGIGSAIARELSTKNVRLVLVSRDEKELKILGSEVGAEKYYSSNLLDMSSIKTLGRSLRKDFKKIDVVIHAAGIGIYKSFDDASFDDWKVSFGLNIDANFLVTKEILQLLKKSDHPVVISLGSGMGKKGFSERSLYCASKFALRGWSLSLAKEYKGKIRFSLVTLGSVLTNFGGVKIEKKKERQEKGKAYLRPEFVASKIASVLEKGAEEDEYTFYPPGYIRERKP